MDEVIPCRLEKMRISPTKIGIYGLKPAKMGIKPAKVWDFISKNSD
jgi:hypothetical protein